VSRKLQVVVDKTVCISNQSCVEIAPGAFRLDSDGSSEVYDVSGATEDAILEAGFNCPAGAIAVTDADTGEDLLA
jgi:ferredoxin